MGFSEFSNSQLKTPEKQVSWHIKQTSAQLFPLLLQLNEVTTTTLFSDFSGRGWSAEACCSLRKGEHTASTGESAFLIPCVLLISCAFWLLLLRPSFLGRSHHPQLHCPTRLQYCWAVWRALWGRVLFLFIGAWIWFAFHFGPTICSPPDRNNGITL